MTRDKCVVESVNGNLREEVVYYYSPQYRIGFLNRFFSYIKYLRLYKEQIDKFIIRQGKPSLVHIHHGMKAGLIALRIKRKMNIPYILTEHWAGFAPEAKPRFEDFPFYVQRMWHRVIKNATAITVVSNYLGKQIQNIFGKSTCLCVIPNVVDTDVFYPDNKPLGSSTKFIHISGLDYQKNPEHILKAFKIVKEKAFSFHLDIIGPEKIRLKDLTIQLGLQNDVSFCQEVSQIKLATYLRKSDALILYSRYESFGCVLAEAAACGLPVIVSDIPVLREIVIDGENGMIVKGEDPTALADIIIKMIHEKDKFSSVNISANAKAKYNYSEIGKRFFDLYRSVLNIDR
jgi:glycosyltransferase involved in cell wall biosynthesis